MSDAAGYDATNAEELAKFRDEWVAEVRQRKDASATSATAPSSCGTHTEESLLSPPMSPMETMSSSSTRPRSPEMTRTQQKARITHTATTHYMSKSMEKALDIYRRAIIHEQAGNLDEALGLYRTAFRLESNVDKAYRKEELRLQLAGHSPEDVGLVAPIHKLATSESGHPALAAGDRPKHLSKQPAIGLLASVISKFPGDVGFTPEDERKAVLLQQLPDEILVSVLRLLDPWSVERFARIGRKARLLSLDPSIWRYAFAPLCVCFRGDSLSHLHQDLLCTGHMSRHKSPRTSKLTNWRTHTASITGDCMLNIPDYD